MDTLVDTSNKLFFLEGGGEMGELIRASDWSKTALGNPIQWPQSLRTMVAVMLNNPFGMYIAWGREFIQLYNDGYRPILGSTKHPRALGISTKETFEEIWHIIGNMFDGVMKGKAVGFPNFMLPLNRNNFIEECYFDFSYSPIQIEDGTVGGILVTVIETTDKKKAEDNLRESELRFRTMADNIPNLAWMANADGWIFWYNKKWHEYTGTTPEQMEGWGWQSVHDPKELPRVLDKWKESIASGKPFEMVFPLKGEDGVFRQFLTRILPVHDSEGKLKQWFGTNTDITERIEAEQAIKESEERFRTMAEGAEVLIATSDVTGKAVYFNKSWTEFTGRSMEELVDFGWTDLIHAQDRDSFLELYLEAFKKKQPWAGEFRILDKNREHRWMLARGTVRNLPDGTFTGYISSSIDITDRKNSEKAIWEKEQNLRNTILQAPVAMCIFRGPSHIVTLANERMFELWGKPAAILLNKPIFEGLTEAKNQGFEELLDRVYSSGKAYSAEGVPVTLPRNDKVELTYVNFVYAPYKETDGTVSGILAIAIDVTAQIQSRQKIEEIVRDRTQALENANNDLQKSNAELAQFAYITSHDLQEPIRKISTFSEMLADNLTGKIDDESIKYLLKIRDSSSRMITLIKDILNYSALTKENEIFEEIDLNKIIETVLLEYDLSIEQKKASIQFATLPTIQANPLQMTQLFGNIIGNSLKFVREDLKPILTISAMDVTEEDLNNPLLRKDLEYTKIQFTDNGIGFKSDYSNQIFGIFQRLHRRSEYAGTGIGLALCKKIVLNHRGIINAIGSSENGAVFNVIIPINQGIKQITID